MTFNSSIYQLNPSCVSLDIFEYTQGSREYEAHHVVMRGHQFYTLTAFLSQQETG